MHLAMTKKKKYCREFALYKKKSQKITAFMTNKSNFEDWNEQYFLLLSKSIA